MSKKILCCCDPDEKGAVSLQQIPNELKSCFRAKEGHSFVSIDFSQMEYRTMAALSGDKKMIEIFNSDEDFYKASAAAIYNIPVSEITPELRDRVKTVYLAVLYGMKTNSIMKRLNISEQEAINLQQRWNDMFPEAVAYKKKAIEYIKATGKAPTYYGRYRDFGNPAKLTDKEIDEGFNSIVQGTAADNIKIATVMASKFLKEKGYGAIKLTLHDELIFELPDKSIEKDSAELKKIMEDSVRLKKEWPLFKSSMRIGKTWAECSK